jgi:hypothetical protein
MWKQFTWSYDNASPSIFKQAFYSRCQVLVFSNCSSSVHGSIGYIQGRPLLSIIQQSPEYADQRPFYSYNDTIAITRNDLQEK